MKKIDRNAGTNSKPDIIDVLINVCRYGALAFAALAVYLVRVKEQAVLWPVFIAIVLLIAGIVLGNVPKKVETSEGAKDKKQW